jgi:hypothetical protein
MMKQQSLTGFERYGKTTRRAQFLADMQLISPWTELTAVVEPFYPRSAKREADRLCQGLREVSSSSSHVRVLTTQPIYPRQDRDLGFEYSPAEIWRLFQSR